jgi:hypothetical protein
MRRRHWGCERPENDAAITELADRLSKGVKAARGPAEINDAVVRFLRGYFALDSTEEDITDTIIRDNVWLHLLKVAKRAVGEERLDELWEAEQRRRSASACTIA